VHYSETNLRMQRLNSLVKIVTQYTMEQFWESEQVLAPLIPHIAAAVLAAAELQDAGRHMTSQLIVLQADAFNTIHRVDLFAALASRHATLVTLMNLMYSAHFRA
jgi:hypothetical protein